MTPGWEERLGTAIGKSMKKKKKKRRGGGGGNGGDSSGTGEDSDLLNSSDDELRYKGAKGAAAYEDERLRATLHPMRRFNDLVRLIMIFLGVGLGQAWRASDALPKLPCGTFVTVKRCLLIFLELIDFCRKEEWEKVCGLVAQATRWLVLQLFVPSRPDLAWRMTFLTDPLPIQCVRANESPDLIDGALQDPRQITAVLGLHKDLASVLEKTKKVGNRFWNNGRGSQNTPDASGTGAEAGKDGGGNGGGNHGNGGGRGGRRGGRGGRGNGPAEAGGDH